MFNILREQITFNEQRALAQLNKLNKDQFENGPLSKTFNDHFHVQKATKPSVSATANMLDSILKNELANQADSDNIDIDL